MKAIIAGTEAGSLLGLTLGAFLCVSRNRFIALL